MRYCTGIYRTEYGWLSYERCAISPVRKTATWYVGTAPNFKGIRAVLISDCLAILSVGGRREVAA